MKLHSCFESYISIIFINISQLIQLFKAFDIVKLLKYNDILKLIYVQKISYKAAIYIEPNFFPFWVGIIWVIASFREDKTVAGYNLIISSVTGYEAWT